MGAYAGPDVVENGLVLCLDAGNTKSYKYRPGPQDHGISDWYCFISGTATYSAIYPNTEIIEIDGSGNEVGIVTTGSDPQRGTFSTTAGRRYYGTKAVHLLQTTASDDQHELAPVSFAGTYFAHYWNRNSPTTYYAYAPFEDVTLEFFDNNAVGGVTGIATATHNISQGLTTSFQSTAVSTWQFFKADKPIIMTAGGTGWDKTILAPATQYNYKRRNANSVTINNTTPSNIGNNITYDTSLPVATVEIADGAGGDCTQGIGYEYLSDTYSWGDVLSDYQIVAPYADTTVTVSYWDSGTSSWVVGETHSLSGTQTSPAAVDRDGTNGFGVDGSTISGLVANLASGANLWKFEGTQPFALIINDNSDDEERLLGWMSNTATRTTSNSDNQILDLSGNSNDGSITNFSDYNNVSLNRYITFDGVDDYSLISLNNPSGDWIHSIEFWMNMNQNQSAISARQDPFQIGTPSTSRYSAVDISNNNFNWYFYSNDCRVTTNLFVANTWYHIGLTYIGGGATSANKQLYVNGVNVPFNTSGSANLNIPANSTLSIGRDHGRTSAYFNGKIANFKIYNRALTAQEVQQNYNATRGRFGI